MFARAKPGHPKFGQRDPALARTLARHMQQTNPMIVIRYFPQQSKVVEELNRMKVPFEFVMPDTPKRKKGRKNA